MCDDCVRLANAVTIKWANPDTYAVSDDGANANAFIRANVYSNGGPTAKPHV
jgi:hypothetical protein